MTDKLEGLRKTVLYNWHLARGAQMVPFAGYEMPVQYNDGILAEHRHTRTKASLFDVGHMGQAVIRGNDVITALEEIVPGDIRGLRENQLRYTQFTNEKGGIIDDLIVTRRANDLLLIVNAICKDKDYAHISTVLGSRIEFEPLEDRSLIALQGPDAANVMSRFVSGAETLPFMSCQPMKIVGISCNVSRSGYTGEDGYEISVSDDHCTDLADVLVAEPEIKLAGLGARDTLRLEAGLCLYGNDLDDATSPIEAGLLWSIGKRRRERGGFLGDTIILDQINNGPTRKRIGILPKGRAPARAHTKITNREGETIGEVTSGGFGPSVDGPISMGYVKSENAKLDSILRLNVRGKSLEAKVVGLPFVEHQYFRG